MRYRLRTLLFLLAIGPPLVAGVWKVAVPTLASKQATEVERFIVGYTSIDPTECNFGDSAAD